MLLMYSNNSHIEAAVRKGGGMFYCKRKDNTAINEWGVFIRVKEDCWGKAVDCEWASGIFSEHYLLLQRKRAETSIESLRNHLSLLLVSSIWFAIQPGDVQINTEEEVSEIGLLMATAERQILICSRCFMIILNGLLEMATEAGARNY